MTRCLFVSTGGAFSGSAPDAPLMFVSGIASAITAPYAESLTLGQCLRSWVLQFSTNSPIRIRQHAIYERHCCKDSCRDSGLFSVSSRIYLVLDGISIQQCKRRPRRNAIPERLENASTRPLERQLLVQDIWYPHGRTEDPLGKTTCPELYQLGQALPSIAA